MPRPLLTKKRAAYAASRKVPPQFKGTPLQNNAAVESRYVVELQALAAQMTAQVKREILRLFKSPAAVAYFGVAMDSADARGAALAGWLAAADAAQPGPNANIASQARILVNSLNQRFNALFAKKGKVAAERMVDGAEGASKTALHASLKAMTGGLSLKTSFIDKPLKAVYNASVSANVSLIKTIASDYLKNVEGSVMRSITTGNGLQDLVPALEKFEGYTHRKARNVALDQTRKAYNSINKGRMQGIGVKRFEWIHSGGGAEPRPLHEAMDGEIYSFDNLPVIDERTGERGIPGQAPNCRCTMRPVFDFSDTDGGESDDDSPELGGINDGA